MKKKKVKGKTFCERLKEELNFKTKTDVRTNKKNERPSN